jgi:uncharacterized protein
MKMEHFMTDSKGPTQHSREITALIALVTESYQPDSPTHDVSHLARVASLGARICAAEGGDPRIVTAAAWLHDLHRDKKVAEYRFFSSPEDFDDRAVDYLTRAGVPKSVHEPILHAIHYTDRYSFSDRFPSSSSIEARCVRDADNLDAVGAIGIARSFTFGGSHDIALWVPETRSTNEEYDQTNRPRSTLHHFHEKLLRLRDEFETEVARRLAERRCGYLQDFVDQFMLEWEEDFGIEPK